MPTNWPGSKENGAPSTTSKPTLTVPVDVNAATETTRARRRYRAESNHRPSAAPSTSMASDSVRCEPARGVWPWKLPGRSPARACSIVVLPGFMTSSSFCFLRGPIRRTLASVAPPPRPPMVSPRPASGGADLGHVSTHRWSGSFRPRSSASRPQLPDLAAVRRQMGGQLPPNPGAYEAGRYRRAPQNLGAYAGESTGTVSTVLPVAGAWIIIPLPA